MLIEQLNLALNNHEDSIAEEMLASLSMLYPPKEFVVEYVVDLARRNKGTYMGEQVGFCKTQLKLLGTPCVGFFQVHPARIW